MNRKPALILCAAGGLIAVAAALSPKTSSQAGVAGAPTVVERDPDSPHRCTGKPEPASRSARFAHGDVRAALSSARMLHGSTGEMYLAVDLAAQAQEIAERSPLSLAVVIDRSGSMSGDKLEQAKRAAMGLIEWLTVRDRVALVQYDDAAQVLLASTNMDVAGKARARALIAELRVGGGTNLHDGMALGRDEVLRQVDRAALNRVLLLSDGNTNTGITDLPTLNRVAGSAAERGVRITTVGLGLDYNEDLMEALAEHGRGQYYYVKDAADLQAVFSGELDNLQATVATSAEVRLVPACEGVEILEVYGYHTTRDGDATVIPMADVIGGDQRKIVARLRVPAGAPGTVNAVRVIMRYQDAIGGGDKTSELALGAEISRDAALVEASADKDVVAAAMEVESARAMRDAAEAYQSGDVQRATRINRRWRAAAEKKATAYGVSPAKSEALFKELDGQADDMAHNAPSSAGGKATIKSSKARARQMSKKR